MAAPLVTDDLVNHVALVRTAEPQPEPERDCPTETELLEAKVVSMRDAIIKEICVLRHDVDTLKRGGWTITVGPFQKVNEPGFESVQAVHDRIIDANRGGPSLLESKPNQNKRQIEAVAREQTRLRLQDLTPPLEHGKPSNPDWDTPELSPLETPDLVDSHIVTEQQTMLTEKLNGVHHSDPGDHRPQAATERETVSVNIPYAPAVASQATNTPMITAAGLSTVANGEADTAVLQHVHTSNETPAELTVLPSAATDPDLPIPSVEDPARNATDTLAPWQPLAIRRLAPLAKEKFAKIPSRTAMKLFSWDFLDSILGGIQWSPSLYYIPPSQGLCILPNRTYYVLENTYEPYLPRHPGAHGAKLTAFFNSNPAEIFGEDAEAAYLDVPVFIRSRNGPDYVYYGTYSQLRWSDKLDYDRMVENVPYTVKMYWAEQLSEVGRPEWVTQALMKHFWPIPEYDGVTTTSVANGSVPNDEEADRKQVLKDVQRHVKHLKEREKEARMKAGLLRKENILEAFEKEDAGDPPGLRLWWEYLECVDWDVKFYEMLVKLQSASPHKR